MEKRKMPVAPIYVSDFFGSARVQLETGLTQAVYLLALLREFQAQGAGLPADENELARLLKLNKRHWGMVRDGVLKFFTRRGDRLFNDTMERRIQECIQRANDVAARARKGALTRWRGQA